VSTVSFSGVGTGNDWTSLITALVTAEKQPATLITQKKSDANTQLSVVGDLVSRLATLSTQAGGYNTVSSLWSINASSSDTSRIKVAASGTGTPGSYSLNVSKLAQGETRQGQALVSGGAGSAGAGSVSIGIGSGTQTKVNYTAADSLADIAARINSNVAGVTASAVYDGTSYHMVLSSSTTGKNNGLNVTESGSGLGLAAPGSVVQPADDAVMTMNGVTAHTASNHITDLIPGVTLDLQSVTPSGASATLISVAKDPSAVSQKVHDLVSAFNSVAQLIHTQQTYSGITRGQDTLFGDPVVATLQRQLGGAMTQAFTHGSGNVMARDLGITLNADGTLAVDDTKLSAKIASDPTAVQDLLAGTGGLGAAINTIAKQYTDTTGPLVVRQTSLKDQMKRYDTQVQEITDRATALQTRLQKQFASLDALMNSYTSNSSFLSSLTKTSSGS